MMYSEFIERTGFNESYVTFEDYTKYIEPVYMDYTQDNKDKFCKKYYKLHTAYVYNGVDMLIAAKSIEEKENYINGNTDFTDIEAIHAKMKLGFLKSLKRLYE